MTPYPRQPSRGEGNMAYNINFYQDQITATGATDEPAKAVPRIVYVRSGEVEINGETFVAGEATAASAELEVTGVADWSQLWRWEVDLPNKPHTLLSGMGLLTQHRMSRLITMLDMPFGSEWLLRLDQITPPAGRVSDPHVHPGPGIRCLLEGTFNVQQDNESYRDGVVGEPWWESGRDEVYFWGCETMHARFLRGMVLPKEHAGEVTGSWKIGNGDKPRGNWMLLVDELFQAPEGVY